MTALKSADFVRQVRDALAHLYDPVYLQTHALAQTLGTTSGSPSDAGGGVTDRSEAGRALRRRLLEAIVRLQPDGKAREAPAAAAAWRVHRLLELRYVEALAPPAVMAQLGLEKSQYYREHARALAALVSLLAEHRRGSAEDGGPGGGAPSSAARPPPLTSFVGRARELAAVRRLLAEVRLLTLTGPAGVGKTRLALEAVAGPEDAFPDGVHVVSLAALRDPSLVLAAVAAILGVREATGRALAGRLAESLREKRLLLVLDNFEALLAAGPDVASVLAACPGVRALVTSREPLRVSGEHRFLVPPLTLPDPAGSADAAAVGWCEAVVLFVARARAVDPDFGLTDANAAAVAGACRRLDGLPLAIELAAARMNVLTPWALLDYLDSRLPLLTGGPRDAPARHHTLREAIAWSYDLLEEHERTLMARLAVFVGGFTLEAAEVMDGVPAGRRDCPAGTAVVGVLDGLASLIDKGLLGRELQPDGHPRFRMLETVRDFALERLEQGGEAEALRRRHAALYLALAERAESALAGADQAAWLDRLERDRDNLRAALRWAKEHRETEAGLRLASALTRFWLVRGTIAEGRRWLEGTLAPDSGAPAWRAKALHRLAELAWSQGDHAAATACLEPCLALRRELCDRAGEAGALNSLGLVQRARSAFAAARALHREALPLARAAGSRADVVLALAGQGAVANQQGDFATARALYQEALPEARAAGDLWIVASVLNSLGAVLMMQGDLAGARALHEEALTLRRVLGDRPGSGRALYLLGSVARRQGDLTGARARFEEALPLYREQGDRWGAAGALAGLGRLHWVEGDLAAARDRFEEALALAREVGDRAGAAGALNSLGQLAALAGEAARAAALLRESLALSREIGVMGDVAVTLEALARQAIALGRPAPGARLFGAAAALRDVASLAVSVADRATLERDVAAARAALGDVPFAREWAAGRATPPERAIDDALSAAPLVVPPPRAEDPAAAASPRPPRLLLTPREREVAALVARGETNRQIASSLRISERTAENHVKHILTKLGARSRTQIAIWVTEHRPPAVARWPKPDRRSRPEQAGAQTRAATLPRVSHEERGAAAGGRHRRG